MRWVFDLAAEILWTIGAAGNAVARWGFRLSGRCRGYSYECRKP